MLRVDPRFERVARRLTALELRSGADAYGGADLLQPGNEGGRTSGAFVDTYSTAGIHRVLDEYGLRAQLAAQGLGDVDIDISQDDPFRHRLSLRLPADVEGDRDVMDMRLHLCTLGVRGDLQPFEVVVVDWLLMQNPRRHFSPQRPQLPGQRHPGTGLGRAVGQLLVLLCRRIGRAGLLTVPEHFHLAELYRRGGYRALDADDDGAVVDLLSATDALSFAERAWAVERGCVRDRDDDAVVTYAPHARVLPVDDGLSEALDPGGRFFKELLRTPRRLRVDRDALHRSLRDHPVQGLLPGLL